MDKSNEFIETYRVTAERTMGEVARNAGCNERLLYELNYQHGRECRRGETVSIPQNECAGGIFYTLKKNQTLLGVAESFGMSLEEILCSNPYLNPSRYREGQVIIIPNAREKALSVTPYIVKETDSLSDILRKFDMNMPELRRANPNHDLFNLNMGDQIFVFDWSEKPIRDGYYLIGQGENLLVLAERFGVSAMELLKANPNVRPQEFREGQRIMLPLNAMKE